MKFRDAARAGVILLAVLYLVHTILRFIRFKQTEWLPHIDSPKMADGIRTMMNLLEKEFAPTMFALTMLISVGALYAEGLILFSIGLLTILVLFCAYRIQAFMVIRLGRFILFAMTISMYGLLLFNEHAFEDSTLP